MKTKLDDDDDPSGSIPSIPAIDETPKNTKTDSSTESSSNSSNNAKGNDNTNDNNGNETKAKEPSTPIKSEIADSEKKEESSPTGGKESKEPDSSPKSASTEPKSSEKSTPAKKSNGVSFFGYSFRWTEIILTHRFSCYNKFEDYCVCGQ